MKRWSERFKEEVETLRNHRAESCAVAALHYAADFPRSRSIVADVS